MNCYAKCLSKLGLTYEAHGKHAFVYLLLSMLSDAADANPQPEESANCFQEVLNRLSAHDNPAVEEIAKLFGTRAHG